MRLGLKVLLIVAAWALIGVLAAKAVAASASAPPSLKPNATLKSAR
jgi:hypothetical protein